MRIRQPAVAGTFYPADANQLQSEVDELLHAAPEVNKLDDRTLKALIVPHAGYIYSGPVAAIGYAALGKRRSKINRVVLLGPSHRVALLGIAVPDCEMFQTPLGNIPLDCAGLEKLAQHHAVQVMDDAHTLEHSLEVHLPFLQTILAEFSLLPLVVGVTEPEVVAEILETLWGGEETLIVISSDLSHFLSYDSARQKDRNTSRLIEALDYTVNGEQACGCYPLNGLLKLSQHKGLEINTLDLRNSGDTAGSHDRVVGYGTYAVYEQLS